MLSTYDRLMRLARITRWRESTYDHRDPYVLIRQLEAQVEVLKRRVRAIVDDKESAL